MKVFYSDRMVVDQGKQGFGASVIKSPSAKKPAELAALLEKSDDIEFVEPHPVSRDDFKLCHEPRYVDRILDLEEENGFGNKSKEVADSLFYTNGAMYDAAKAATVDSPTCALVAGFHHAGYDHWEGLGYFCTFNGLMVTAMKFYHEGKRTLIVDCDMHWGNGTDHILLNFPEVTSSISHISFGKHLYWPHQAEEYLGWLGPNGRVYKIVEEFKPDVILYQAGADVHIDDPYGGILTTEQILERDRRMFQIAHGLKVPLAWNLAGGYQLDEDGSARKVLDIHLNTFDACRSVY